MDFRGVEVGSVADLLTGIGTIGLMVAAFSATKAWRKEAVGRRRMQVAEKAMAYIRNVDSNLNQLAVFVELLMEYKTPGQYDAKSHGPIQHSILNMIDKNKTNIDAMLVEVDIVFGQVGVAIIEDADTAFTSYCAESGEFALIFSDDGAIDLPERIRRDVAAIRERADRHFLSVIRNGG